MSKEDRQRKQLERKAQGRMVQPVVLAEKLAGVNPIQDYISNDVVKVLLAYLAALRVKKCSTLLIPTTLLYSSSYNVSTDLATCKLLEEVRFRGDTTVISSSPTLPIIKNSISTDYR